MFRTSERHLQRLTLEVGLKIFRRLDDAAIRQACRTAFDNWRRLVADAREVRVMLWIGDGDEVFSWRGRLDDAFAWNDTIGFNNLKYGAYPENRHYRTWSARPYMDHPPKFTYGDLKRVIETLRTVAREQCGLEITVGSGLDAGPEFVESPFKFERHPELLKGGPKSEFPKSLRFLCCHAALKGDDFPYAGFPQGLPDGTPLGTFLGRQFQSLADALGIDFVWFSNGFGLTHYAWNYLGEGFDGRRFHPDRAPEGIRQFLSFWRAFRAECPQRPILIRGTNYSVGMDAAAHGIDLREIYRAGQLELPPPNPPWGTANLGLEIAAHLSRISSTPTRAFMFRYYINDSWFASVPWYDYYNREPFDIYCPMSTSRLSAVGAAETATDFHVMTVNTGFGEMFPAQAGEVEPHVRRAFDTAPDQAGPLVWVYPFAEYQDELHRPDGRIEKSFFGDWFVARAITNGLPLNTVISTENFVRCAAEAPAVLAASILVVPAPASGWTYADAVLDHVRRGGQAIFYGSLRGAPPALLDALNLTPAEEIEGDLDVTLKMEEDAFDLKPPRRPLRHLARQSDGGVGEVLANPRDKSTAVRATVGRGRQKRVYALVRRKRGWQGGQLGWIRGTLPFEAKPDSNEPTMFPAEETHDATVWFRYLLSDFALHFRQSRHSPAAKPVYLFAARSRGSWFLSGHKPDATAAVAALRFADGAPILCERQTLVKRSTAAYFFERSFHFECQAFVRQEQESLVGHKEDRTTPDQMRCFTLSGLRDAVVTLYVPPQAVAEKRLQVRKIIPYLIHDPTAADGRPRKKGEVERDLNWQVEPHTGGVVVEKISGSVTVRY